MEKTLKQFKPKESGTVVRVTAQGAVKRRLFDMGITPGAKIVMRKAAPMGDPIEIRIRGYELSLRKAESEYILMDCEVSPKADLDINRNHCKGCLGAIRRKGGIACHEICFSRES